MNRRFIVMCSTSLLELCAGLGWALSSFFRLLLHVHTHSSSSSHYERIMWWTVVETIFFIILWDGQMLRESHLGASSSFVFSFFHGVTVDERTHSRWPNWAPFWWLVCCDWGHVELFGRREQNVEIYRSGRDIVSGSKVSLSTHSSNANDNSVRLDQFHPVCARLLSSSRRGMSRLKAFQRERERDGL